MLDSYSRFQITRFMDWICDMSFELPASWIPIVIFFFQKCSIHTDSYTNPAALLKTNWYPDPRSLDLFCTPVFILPVS